MREAHSSEKDGITGSTRSHIVSRLRKACTYADHLYHMLSDKQSTGATDVDCYEARAYAYCLRGAMDFEKQAWEGCVKNYSEARVIYTALGILTSQDVFEELVADPIDPSIRYGAYQLGIPRTLAVSAVAQRYFPADSELVQALGHLDSRVLQDKPAQTLDAGSMPKHITWRSREVALEDASIATALALVNIASDCLAAELGSTGDRASGERASAYDNLLIASQDAVDATKAAIDDLLHEGINRSDKRIQSLQITKTALTYELISWRVGRYRVLLGGQDGVLSDLSGQPPRLPNERLGRQLGEQREKSVIYDAIIQSLEAIKELPGVAADSTLLLEIDAKHAYFEALKYV